MILVSMCWCSLPYQSLPLLHPSMYWQGTITSQERTSIQVEYTYLTKVVDLLGLYSELQDEMKDITFSLLFEVQTQWNAACHLNYSAAQWTAATAAFLY